MLGRLVAWTADSRRAGLADMGADTESMQMALAVLALSAMTGCATRPRCPGSCCFTRIRQPTRRCAG